MEGETPRLRLYFEVPLPRAFNKWSGIRWYNRLTYVHVNAMFQDWYAHDLEDEMYLHNTAFPDRI